MDVSLTAADLLTVAGASAVAVVIAQIAKTMFSLGAAAVRSVAIAIGVVVVVGATITTGTEITFVTIVLAVYVGGAAGLSASAQFDTATKGLDYQANPPTQ